MGCTDKKIERLAIHASIRRRKLIHIRDWYGSENCNLEIRTEWIVVRKDRERGNRRICSSQDCTGAVRYIILEKASVLSIKKAVIQEILFVPRVYWCCQGISSLIFFIAQKISRSLSSLHQEGLSSGKLWSSVFLI